MISGSPALLSRAVNAPVELSPRTVIARWSWIVLAVGLVLTPVSLASTRGLQFVMSVALGLLTVVLPAVALWSMRGRRIVVHADRVVVQRHDRPLLVLAYSDLTAVAPIVDGSSGVATPELLNKGLVLRGADDRGRQRALKVTTLTVDSIDPLLRALSTEVRQRPELLSSQQDRTLFAEYLGESDIAPPN